MARAGIHLVPSGKLSFRADGRWYADGELVTHQRLASLFSRHLRRASSGGFEIWLDEGSHAEVDVEDTPYVVTTATVRDDGAVSLELNDGTLEALAPEGLSVARDHVMYCAVKGGAERARLLRPAVQHLAAYIEEGDTGGFRLRCGNLVYPIAEH